MGMFFVFRVIGEKFNEFWVPEVLNRYLESTGLRGTDYIFPRFRNEEGKVVARA